MPASRIRSSWLCRLLLLIPVGGLVNGQGTLLPCTAPIRDGGTYHVATGTWTRKASQAALSANIAYDNTCISGYYSALLGDTYTDEGRLPSPTSPTSTESLPGTTTRYTVDGFQIAYCTDQPTVGVWTIDFRESHPACAPINGVPTTTSIAIPGLPGAPAGGQMCWTVTLDLIGPGGSLSFWMQADGDGSYEGAAPAGDDRFAWSMRSSLPIAQQAGTGPVLAGDPTACPPATGGTGIGSLDQFRFDRPGLGSCIDFPNEFSSFHLRLYAPEAEPGTVPGEPICVGDGVAPHTPCPCANHSTPADAAGCLNSLGLGARLRGSGVASIGAESAGQAHLTLSADRMPVTTFAMLFQGTIAANSGNGLMLGDGLRCSIGALRRIGTVQTIGGAGAWPPPGGPLISVQGQVTNPGTRFYQVMYRNNVPFCTPDTFNFSNGLTVVWAF